jgi:signal transduction histidine kinase
MSGMSVDAGVQAFSSSGRRRAFKVSVGAVVLVGAYLAYAVVTSSADPMLVQVAGLIATVFATATCSYAAFRATNRLRRAWFLMALAAAALGIGNLIYTYMAYQGVALPFPSAADAFYLVSYPLSVASILSFPSAPGRNATRGRALLDGATIAVSLFFISWALGLGNVYESSSSADLLTKSVGLAYPIGDVFIATALVVAISRARRSMRIPLLLALCGLGLNAIADSAFAFMTASGSLSSALGTVIAATFVMGYLTFGLGALYPATTLQAEAEEGEIGLARASFPWISALAVAVTTGLILATGGRLDVFLAFPAACLFTLLMTSQLITYRDSLSLLRKSEETEAQVEKLSLAKSEVMSIVSHEFRNALVGIQGFSEMMRDQNLPSEDVKSFSSDIYNDSERLTRMINEMLDLDRLEAGRVELDLMAVDLNAKVREVVERARVSSKKCTIETRLDAALPPIMADADRLFQVISNLLSNAIKYSPEGGEVLITTNREDGKVAISVKDHGRGMPPEALSRLFQRYERIDENQGGKISGTGLGLVIAREIIEMHQGKIWVESTVGSGSEFNFTIPIPAGSVPVPPPEVIVAKAA